MNLRTVVAFLILTFGLTNAIVPEDDISNFDFVEYSTNLDNPQYRLRDIVQPTFITVDLDVYLTESRFNGFVTLDIRVLESVTQIVLHQDVGAVTGVTVVDRSGNIVALQPQNAFETDNYYQIITLNFASTVTPGEYRISIRYLGRINENPLNRGFYKGYYYVGNDYREYATTQFQPFYARHAFPCFDEPQFKCPFLISITRDNFLRESYSNMAINTTEILSNNRVKETFLPTPTISAYLIAFHVSSFVATNSTSTVAKPVQIISREGVTDQHEYAARLSRDITNYLDGYLNYNYYDMGQGQPMKNDHIALPDFPSGAMENWGMVNYREAYLLYDPANTNILNKLFIATIVAHELAHKWFGNLVTCFWWSNLWLNESFASYFEYFGAHPADNFLELPDRYIIDQVQSALAADASAGAQPMNWTGVADNPSIWSHFSTTSYAKGSSVLRMLEHFVGYDTFRNALRYYIRDNAYGVAYPIDMYNAFRTAVAEDPTFASTYPNVNIGAVFENWVQNPGSPLVTATVNTTNGVISLTQERFLVSGSSNTQTIWQIPITWTHGGSPNFNNLKPSVVMSTASATIQAPQLGQNWVILNLAQSGLYRVNYDDQNWARIATQLRNNHTIIHKLSRSQIVNDVLYFIRSGRITMERAFDVLSFLKDETDYYVWAGALGQIDWIRRRLEHIPRAHEEFSKYILDLMENSIEAVGYDEKSDDSASIIQQRMQILNYACNLGHEGCIRDSEQKWSQFRTTPSNLVPVNARRYVYCTGIRNGNDADYNFLFQHYNSSQNTADMVVTLRALGCTTSAANLRHYLTQSMQNDRIRIHDKTNAFQYALLGNEGNLQTVLNFLYENFREISTTYGGVDRLNICINALAGHLTKFSDIVAFQTWLYDNQEELGVSSFNAGVAVVTNSMANLEWGSSQAEAIFRQARGGSAGLTASLALVFVALFARYLN